MVMPRSVYPKSKKEDIDDAVLNSEYDEKRKNYKIRDQLLKKYEDFKQKKMRDLFLELKNRLDATKNECGLRNHEFNPILIEGYFSQKSFTINCRIGTSYIQFSEIRETNISIGYKLLFLKECSICKKELFKEEFNRFSELLYLIDKYKEPLQCKNCSSK